MNRQAVRFAAILIAFCVLSLVVRTETSSAAVNVSVSLNNGTPAFSGPVVGIGGQTDPFMFFPHQIIKGVTEDDFATLMARIKKGGISFVRIWLQVDWDIPNVQRGKEYAFSGWVKTSGVMGGEGAFVAVSAKDFDGNIMQEARTASLAGTNGWTYV